MRPQSCKAKGRRFQQKVVADLLRTFAHLAPDDVVSTSMGAGGEDIRLSKRARDAIPLSFECKNQEKLSLWSALEQATRNTPSQAQPCLVFSRNNSKTYACVPWEFFLELISAYDKRGEGGLPPRLEELLREVQTFLPPPQTREGAE